MSYFSASSITPTITMAATTFTDVSTVVTFNDRFSSGITRNGSAFTFANGGVYFISFNVNSYGNNQYLALRLRRTNGAAGTLLQRTWYTGAQSTADQPAGILSGLFQVTAGDIVNLQYAIKSGTQSSWGASNPIDAEQMSTAQIDIWRVQ